MHQRDGSLSNRAGITQIGIYLCIGKNSCQINFQDCSSQHDADARPMIYKTERRGGGVILLLLATHSSCSNAVCCIMEPPRPA